MQTTILKGKFLIAWFLFCMSIIAHAAPSVEVIRLNDEPIIHPKMHSSIDNNIQGPTVIRVPDWLQNPLGKYYLYFADHKGAYIRLAYADEITGPWKIYEPGSLQLKDSHFLTEAPQLSEEREVEIRKMVEARGVRLLHDVIEEVTTPHIASPDVHVDHENKRIVMYYHGLEGVGHQVSRVAVSDNGIDFTAQPDQLGKTYMRIFHWQDDTYALAMPGQLYRARGQLALNGFESGPLLFNKDMRHNAVLVWEDQLLVFWTQVGDAPEHIKLSTIELQSDWQQWQESSAQELLRPTKPWEGSEAPLEPSLRSSSYRLVNQLRDPAILVDEGKVYLFYAIGGESGIAVVEMDIQS